MNLRNILKKTFSLPIIDPSLAVFEKLETKRTNLLRVLTYHRIPHVQLFTRHIEHISKHHHVTSAEELESALSGETVLPPRSLMITFDDGYRDVAVNAWPIMADHGLPAVLFVASHFPDRPTAHFWWDKLYRAIMESSQPFLETPFGRLVLGTKSSRIQHWRRLRSYLKKKPHHEMVSLCDGLVLQLDVPPSKDNEVLGWQEIRSLSRAGMTIGAHTRFHPLLNRVDEETVCTEISGSMVDIEEQVGYMPRFFAYPSGHYNSRVRSIAKDMGIRVAFTTYPGINNLQTSDPLLLRRINITPDASPQILRARILQSSNFITGLRPLPPSFG